MHPDIAPTPDPSIIKPTIGRRLWFWPAPASLDRSACAPRFKVIDPLQPLDAGIVYVWSDRLVNLSVTDHAGLIQAVTSVRLLQPGESANPGEAYAEWMPYQAAQNAKAAAPAPGPAPSLPGDSYVYPTRREEAMHALVSGAAMTIAQGGGDAAARIADNILAVVNKLHPQAGEQVATQVYADGTTATGVAPLPALSPSQQDLETEIQTKADKAPRVTPQALQDEIASVHFFTAAEGCSGRSNGYILPDGFVPSLNLLTICVIVLKNGFTVIGHSACASPENFNAEIGERIARENAERQVWPLLGFRLKDSLGGF